MPSNLLHLGPLHLPLYGLFASAGLVAALALTQRVAGSVGLSGLALWDAGMTSVLSAYLISRALLLVTNFHAFVQYPLLLLAVPSLTPGGLLLTALFMAVYLRRKRLPLLATLDAFAPSATLLWAFLALGDAASHRHAGMMTQLPWALQDPAIGPLHPVELYTAVAALALTGVLLLRLTPARPPGRLLSEALVMGGLIGFCLDFFRQPSPRPLPLLDPAQWLALAAVVAGALLNLTMPHTTPTSTTPEPQEAAASHAL